MANKSSWDCTTVQVAKVPKMKWLPQNFLTKIGANSKKNTKFSNIVKLTELASHG